MTSTSQTPPTLGRCPDCGTVIASLDVRIDDACEATDGALLCCIRDVSDGLELGVRVDREPRLDDVGPHLVEHRSDVSLLVVTERRTWRLLSVSQRRVENSNTVYFTGTGQRALEELDPPGYPTNPPCR